MVAIQDKMHQQRATGRTTELAKRVTSEDRVVFKNHQCVRAFERIMQDVGNKSMPSLVVVDSKKMNTMFSHCTVQGATYFDHYFIEDYLQDKLLKAGNDLELYAKQTCKKPYDEAGEDKVKTIDTNRMNKIWIGEIK